MSKKEPIGAFGVFGVTLLAIGIYSFPVNFWHIEKHKEVIEKVEGLERRIKEIERPYQLQIKNTVGEETPEKFYEINGQKVYLEIDGKLIEEYFTNNNSSTQ